MGDRMILQQIYQEKEEANVTKFKTLKDGMDYYSKKGFHAQKISRSSAIVSKDGWNCIIILYTS